MTTVKFDKSVKYNGIRYSAHEAFKVADKDVAQLRKDGATVLSTEHSDPVDPNPSGPDCDTDGNTEKSAENQNSDSGEDVAKLREDLLKYTAAQLAEFAKERGINLEGKTRKADIYNTIVAALN